MGIYEMETARRKKQGDDSEIAYNIYKIREVEELGFMTGKSGIGYWMEKRKKDYPNILLLKV